MTARYDPWIVRGANQPSATAGEAERSAESERSLTRRNLLLRGLGALAAGRLVTNLVSEPTALAATHPRRRRVVDVRNYGAVGDGRKDDTVALQAAIDDAGSGGRVRAPAGRTFLISQTLVLRRNRAVIDFGGSTLKLAGTPGGPMLQAAASRVVVQRVRLDGSRRAGGFGNGIEWYGAGGELRHCELVDIGGSGVVVNNAKASVVCVRVHASDCRSGRGTAAGFYCGAGTLRTVRCRATFCERAGFFFDRTCSRNCVLDGTSRRNAIGALLMGRAGGRVGRFTAHDDDRFGLLFNKGASHWTCRHVEANRIGESVRNAAGTGIELFRQNRHNYFRTIVCRANPGYGLALGNGSSDNRFDRVVCDARGAWDSDPGITITSGSHRNRIKRATVVRHSVGVQFGEDNVASNDANEIGRITVVDSGWSGVRFEYGRGNSIGHARMINCWCADFAFPGVIDFGNSVSGNTISYLDQSYDQRTAMRGAIPPAYAVHCAAQATNNRIQGGRTRGWKVARVKDENGRNRIHVRG
jgi:Pectate lyase superfamily protein